MAEDAKQAVNVRGIQLAIFEIIWSAFRWIHSLYLETSENRWTIRAHVIEQPSREEWSDYCRLMKEILDVGGGKGKTYEFLIHNSMQIDDHSIKLMSGSIFKEIATEFAPWRLPAGR